MEDLENKDIVGGTSELKDNKIQTTPFIVSFTVLIDLTGVNTKYILSRFNWGRNSNPGSLILELLLFVSSLYPQHVCEEGNQIIPAFM